MKKQTSNFATMDLKGIPLTEVALYCLLFAFVLFAIAVLFGLICGVTKADKIVLTWLMYDGLTHLLMEGPFVYFSLISTVNNSDHISTVVWKEYAKADRRWGISDPTIVSLEILTVLIDGPLAFILCYAIIKGKSYRHFVQVVLSVCELYGGFMTFCPEWLTGSANLVTSNFLYLWVYLIFFNMLWVVMPIALLGQSWKAMGSLPGEGEMEVKRDVITETYTTTSVTHKYNTRSKKTQ